MNSKEIESAMAELAETITGVLTESFKNEDLDARYFLAIDVRSGNEGRVTAASDIPPPMLADWLDALKGRLKGENKQ